MRKRSAAYLVAATVSLAALVSGINHANHAVAAGDGDDNVFPPALAVTATNSTNIVFNGQIAGAAYTVTCQHSVYQFVTPAAGIGPTNMPVPPTYLMCTDNLGGAVNVATRGQWVWELLDLAGEPEPSVEPNAIGDAIRLTIARGGITFTPAAVPGCVVTAAPAAAFPIDGAFNEIALTHTYGNTPFPVAGAAGCGAVGANWTISGTYTMNKAFHDIS